MTARANSALDLIQVRLKAVEQVAGQHITSGASVAEHHHIQAALVALHLGNERLPDLQELDYLDLRQSGDLALRHYHETQGLVLREREGRGHAPDVLF